MQEKEMFLLKISKNKLIFFLPFLFITFFLPNQSNGNQAILGSQISKYFFKINNFTSKFIQSDSDGVQEGDIYISNKVKRIKIHYTEPSNIVFILKNNKAMYYNVDLEEVEYFSTKNSVADIFFNVFYDEEFFFNSTIIEKENTIEIKKIININEENKEIFIFFERNPLIIKQIKIKENEGYRVMTFINPNFNITFRKNFFSIANPLLN
ncbi:outer-membrane lipoprotein carrier protein LolA [Alphaproteobacteria bacterium]|nr:outer-membrane lipoprotein carrier protein LolA [Alphaproteobacteria bacterium]